MSDRHPNLVNISDVAPQEIGNGGRFGGLRRVLGRSAGGKQLGCSHLELPPGKRGFPFHYHLANEEAAYILEGEGSIRIGDRQVPVRAGDYIALPSGASHAHQLINTSGSALRFLAMSTMQQPEVAVYPDSKKIGVLGGSNSAEAGGKPLMQLNRLGDSLGYFDGEE